MKEQVNTDDLRALGVSRDNNKNSYLFDFPDPNTLEKFETPSRPETNRNLADMMLNITASEFSSLCPITGQPDYATIMIDYIPDQYCVESKSMKLYLNGFRNHGEFHESCVNRIINDLIDLLDPHWMRVVGFFTPRGGIPFHPSAEWSKDEYQLPPGLAARLRNDPFVPYAPN